MSTPSKFEILVVDDDDAVRDSIGLLLQMSGYHVSTAKNGFDALLQLKRSLPSIILSDLNMPQMSGFEFLSVVRRRFPKISVIAMSGAYDSESHALPYAKRITYRQGKVANFYSF